jgi:hypothetical protein
MVLPATALSKEITMADYAPQSLADVVIGDEFSEDAVRYIASGSLPFPGTGKNGLLIFGPYGTGKSTLGKLLPSEIEKLHGVSTDPFVWCREADEDGKENGKMLKSLDTASKLVPLGDHFNHFVIDEVDLLSSAHQRKLRNIMNVKGSIFYFTTNDLGAIDRGVRSRCHEIHLCAASARKWLPLFSKVLSDLGASVPSEASLLPLIDSCNGSVRDIVAAAQLLASRRIAAGNVADAANSNGDDQIAA